MKTGYVVGAGCLVLLAALVGLVILGAILSPTGSRELASGAPSVAQAQGWEIVSVESKVTEQNDVFWRHAWRLTIRNRDSAPLRFNATIEFQDAEGFVISEDNAYGLSVPGDSEETFTGYDLIQVPGARRVAQTNAKVTVR